MMDENEFFSNHKKQWLAENKEALDAFNKWYTKNHGTHPFGQVARCRQEMCSAFRAAWNARSAGTPDDVLKAINDDEAQAIDERWSTATSVEKLAWHNNMAKRRRGASMQYVSEILELTNYFAALTLQEDIMQHYECESSLKEDMDAFNSTDQPVELPHENGHCKEHDAPYCSECLEQATKRESRSDDWHPHPDTKEP